LGYVDAEGKEVIVPHFDSAGYADAATGYERVVINDKWGLVDLQGKEVLPLRFDLILDGHHVADDIIALARKGTKWHWFDKKGKKVVPDYVRQAKARNLTPKRFSDTYSYGYVNEHDAVVIPPRFDEAKDFDEHGLALVRLGEKWGWINRKGKIAIPLRFDVAAGFDVDARGLARVGIGESCAGDFEGYTGERHSRLCRWGFVDIRGREIIPLRFDEIGEFDDRGLAVVSRAGKWGIVDIRGGEIVPARFPELYFGELAGDAAALVREGNTWTWFDHKGRAVIPAHVRGTNARELRSWKSARNRVGYVDPEGRIVIPPRFDEAFERFISVDDTTEVKWRGRWVQIDARGRIVK
jgi:hypothetical protein